MRCPVCSADLVLSRYHELVLPRCAPCAGTWFGAGMLKACVDAMIKAGGVPDAGYGGRAPVAVARLAEPAYPCPRCVQPMQKLNYGYDSNVIVDHCAACDGVWADDKELLAVAVYTKGNPHLNALGEAFLEESGRLRDTDDKAGFVARMFNPFAWALPYRTSVPVVLAPAVMSALMALNILVFFLEPSPRAPSWAGVLRLFGVVPALVSSGHNYHSFLTSMFLHLGFLHLAGNMYFLWLFGRNVESALGHADFLILYLVSGLTAGVLQTLLDPGSIVPMAGASGAIAGVLGCYLRLYPKSRIDVWMGRGNTRTYSAKFYLGAWFAMQLFSLTKNAAFGASSGVAFAAHIGGFAAGYLLAPADTVSAARAAASPT